ncbi:hypothetical protein MKD33_12330, partial [Chromobacterium piscinae]
FYYKRR